MTFLEKEEQSGQGKSKPEQNPSTQGAINSTDSGSVLRVFSNILEPLALFDFGFLLHFVQTVFFMASKFLPERDIPDLAGKVILVTGGWLSSSYNITRAQ